jgi:predicted aldo/keto reductase-like oxidoreductase
MRKVLMNHNEMGRREFVRRAAGTVAAGLWIPNLVGAAVPQTGRVATAQVSLGRTGIRMSRLGIGTGTIGGGRQSNQTRLGQEAFSRLVQHAFERGITYIDAADSYGSHTFIRHVLKEIPRDRMTILSKVGGSSRKGTQEDIERFLKELGTDYIDILLLHCMTRSDWPKRMASRMDALSAAKERKLVRAVGVSCHSVEGLKAAAESPWVDVVLARINHDGEKMDAKPEVVVPVLRKIHDAGKAVLGMKIAGEGRLVDQLDKSLEYVLKLDCVDAMTIGFEKTAEVDDTISRMEKAAKAQAATSAGGRGRRVLCSRIA